MYLLRFDSIICHFRLSKIPRQADASSVTCNTCTFRKRSNHRWFHLQQTKIYTSKRFLRGKGQLSTVVTHRKPREPKQELFGTIAWESQIWKPTQANSAHLSAGSITFRLCNLPCLQVVDCVRLTASLLEIFPNGCQVERGEGLLDAHRTFVQLTGINETRRRLEKNDSFRIHPERWTHLLLHNTLLCHFSVRFHSLHSLRNIGNSKLWHLNLQIRSEGFGDSRCELFQRFLKVLVVFNTQSVPPTSSVFSIFGRYSTEMTVNGRAKK